MLIGKDNLVERITHWNCPSWIYLNEDDPPDSINCLFCDCSNIVEFKFLNFDTSLLIDMTSLFQNCIFLILVDISNLNIQNVNLMR